MNFSRCKFILFLLLITTISSGSSHAAVEVPFDIAAALPKQTSPEIRQLVRTMTTPGDAMGRGKAALELATYGEEAVLPLIWMLRVSPHRMASYEMIDGVLGKKPVRQPASDPIIVAHVYWALAAVGLPAVDPLVDLLKEPRPHGNSHLQDLFATSPATGETFNLEKPSLSRTRAVSALVGFGPVALAVLADHYKTGDKTLRWNIVRVMVRMSDPLYAATAPNGPAVAPFLTLAAGDPDAQIRLEAIKRLEDIANGRSTGILLRALADTDMWIKMSAARALGRTGDRAAVAPLIKTLKDARGDLIYACIKGLAGLWQHDDAFGALMEIFSGKELGSRRVANRSLKEETGQDHGFDVIKWTEWRRERLYGTGYLKGSRAEIDNCGIPTCHSNGLNSGTVHNLAKEGRCDSCHLEAEGMLIEGLRHASLPPVDVKDTCLKCHSEISSGKEGNTVIHIPVAEGKCGSCHSPHDARGPSLLSTWGWFEPDFPKGPLDGREGPLCLTCHGRSKFSSQDSMESGFRNRELNLHWVHIQGKNSRRCSTCHKPHSATQPALLRAKIPFGNQWSLDLVFTQSEKGGSCRTGCHRDREYRR